MISASESARPGRGKERWASIAAMALIAIALASLLAALRREGSFAVDVGGIVEIEALILLAIAWIGHLRKDGLGFLSWRKATQARAPESWRDRVPSMGEAPAPTPPIPDERGPKDEAYERLQAAESELRRRIAGETDDARGRRPDGADRGKASIRKLAATGVLLFVLGLGLEYLAPLLLRR